ncbi:MAG: hypothetical protein ABI861_00670, partial [Panacibacter sp.]
MRFTDQDFLLCFSSASSFNLSNAFGRFFKKKLRTTPGLYSYCPELKLIDTLQPIDTTSCPACSKSMLPLVLLHFTAITKIEIVKIPRRVNAIVLIQLVESSSL